MARCTVHPGSSNALIKSDMLLEISSCRHSGFKMQADAKGLTAGERAWIFHGPRDPPLVDWTSAQVLDRGEQYYSDRTAIVSSWQSMRWTYHELRQETRRLAASLVHRGVTKGDRVVVLAGNSMEYVQLYFAVTSIGAVFVIINAIFTHKETIDAIETVGESAD